MRLTKAAREIAALRRADIDRLKLAAKAWDDPHFIWNALLVSFATMGNSRGAKLVEDESIRVKVDFEVLRRLSSPQRRIAIYNALIEATVRMPRIKTTWLMDNHERIVADGGPVRVKALLEACPGREAKIGFLKLFRGIGDKYSRNILMDVYHPEFRHSIAYDERLKKVSEALGVSFGSSYRAAEEFFLGVAKDTGLSGWELDRLLYGYTKEVLAALGKAECRSAAPCKSE